MAGSPSLQASEKGQAGCVHLDTIEQHLVSLTGLDRHGVSTIGDLFGLCLRIAASLGQVPGVTTALARHPVIIVSRGIVFFGLMRNHTSSRFGN